MLPPLHIELSTEEQFRIIETKMLIHQVNREELEQMFLDLTKQVIVYKKLFKQQVEHSTNL